MTHTRVFISYKSEDSQEVRAVVDMLRAHGVHVWFAEYEALSSNYDQLVDRLDSELKNAVKSSTHAVIFSNSSWAASVHCRNELDWICERFRDEPSRVLHVLTPDQPMPDLSSESTTLLKSFDAISYPDDPLGYVTVASELLKRFVNKVPSVVERSRKTTGELFQVREGGYWTTLRFDGVSLWQSINDYHQQSDPLRARHWRGEVDGVVVDINISINPFETLLDPWILANRSNRGSANSEMIDDRQVYAHLRQAARRWLRTQRLTEHGLHLFWHQQLDPNEVQESSFTRSLGKMALTCQEKNARGTATWLRKYLLVVVDPWSGCIGQVSLTVSMPWTSDDEQAELCRFLGIAPMCDRIAETVSYYGCPQKTWGEFLLTFLVSASVAIGLIMLVFPGSVAVKVAIGALYGLLTTPSLMKRTSPSLDKFHKFPVRPSEYHSKKYGYTLEVPVGWTVSRGITTTVTNRMRDVDVLLVPIGRRFPSMALNVATDVPNMTPEMEVGLTRDFAKRVRQQVESEVGVDHLSLNEIVVGGISAFELVYTRSLPNLGAVAKAKPTGFCKIGCFHKGRQFFFQASCADFNRDLNIMRTILRSFRVHGDYELKL